MMPLLVVSLVVMFASFSSAKPATDQDRIILLNDTAEALKDSDPGLSRSVAEFADEKEKEWEYNNAHKEPVVAAKNTPEWNSHIRLLKQAAVEIKPVYPLIAQGLVKMAKDMEDESAAKK